MHILLKDDEVVSVLREKFGKDVDFNLYFSSNSEPESKITVCFSAERRQVFTGWLGIDE